MDYLIYTCFPLNIGTSICLVDLYEELYPSLNTVYSDFCLVCVCVVVIVVVL